jgi:hypothetical protein
MKPSEKRKLIQEKKKRLSEIEKLEKNKFGRSQSFQEKLTEWQGPHIKRLAIVEFNLNVT